MRENSIDIPIEATQRTPRKHRKHLFARLLQGVSLLFVMFVGIVMAADIFFRRMVNGEVAILLANSGKEESGEAETGELNERDFEGLPAPVERYFRRSLPAGEPPIRTVRLQQQGDFRAGLDQPWMKFTAVEYITAPNPGFLWSARAQAAPGLWVRVRDYYLHGEISQGKSLPANFSSGGGMFVKMLSLIPIENERPGPAIDQNNLVRYLCEAPWMPAVLLPSERLHWEPIDENHARAILTDRGYTAEMVFTFNAKGDIVAAMGTRLWQGNGDSAGEETAWGGTFGDHQTFEGIRIPTTGHAKWVFADGTEFVYGKFEVTDAAFDVRESW